jgi:hypothetical protein
MSTNVIRLISGVNKNFAERLATNGTDARDSLPVATRRASVCGKMLCRSSRPPLRRLGASSVHTSGRVNRPTYQAL